MKLLFALLLVLFIQSTLQLDYTSRSTSYWNSQFHSCRSDEHWSWQHWQIPSGVGYTTATPSGLQDLINTLYPEGSRLTQGLISDEIAFTPKVDTDAYITYFSTGAWYFNNMGIYYADPACTGSIPSGANRNDHMCHDGIRRVEFFKKLSSNNYFVDRDCLKSGDTIKKPVKAGVKYGIYLFANGDELAENQLDIFYSNTKDFPHLASSDNTPHTSWIFSGAHNLTIFGYEDALNGDYDYNDVMFTITVDGDADFTNRPISNDDGSVTACLPLQSVTTTSYIESECFAYALLESSEPSACNLYLKPPTGWDVVTFDTPEEKEALVSALNSDMALSKWSTLSCFGVEENGQLVGIDRDGNSCDGFETYENEYEDAECRGVRCNSRAIIKKAGRLTPCRGDSGFCLSEAREASRFPTQYEASFPVNPETSSVYLDSSSDVFEAEVTSTVIYDGVSPPIPVLDILLAVDTCSLSNDDVNVIRGQLVTMYNNLNQRFAYRIAVGAFKNNVFVSNPFGSSFDQAKIDELITRSSCSSSRFTEPNMRSVFQQRFAWRDNAFKVVYYLTKRNAPNTSGSDLNRDAINNNVAIFTAAFRESTSAWNTFTNNLSFAGTSRIYREDYNNFNDLSKGLVSNIDSLFSKSVAVVGSERGSGITADILDASLDFGNYRDADNQADPINHRVRLTLSNPSAFRTSDYVDVHILGRGVTRFRFLTNNSPTTSRVRSTVEGGQNSAISISSQDIDNDLLKYTFTFDSSELETLGISLVVASSGLPLESGVEYLENPLVINVATDEEIDTFEEFSIPFTVSDGCASVSSGIDFEHACIGEVCNFATCPLDRAITVVRGEVREIPLSGFSENQAFPVDPSNVRRSIISTSADFYNDIGLSESTEEGDAGSVVFFSSSDTFGLGTQRHTLRYVVYNYAQDPIRYSHECQVRITVNPANTPPEYEGNSNYVTLEDTPFSIVFNVRDFTFETSGPSDRLRVKVDLSTVTRGAVVCCNADGDSCSESLCSNYDGIPVIRYTPVANDFGACDPNDEEIEECLYEKFNVIFEDSVQSDPSQNIHEVTVHVLPVNDAPVIQVAEGINVGAQPNIIEKGDSYEIEWQLRDIDNVPSELQTQVSAIRISRQPFETFTCSAQNDCTDAISFEASGAVVNSYTTSVVNCATPQQLYSQNGNEESLANCYSSFKMVFVPDTNSYAIPYIRFTLTGNDNMPQNSFSESRDIFISVIPKNLPPIVTSPEEIVSPSSVVNVRAGSEVVIVTDDAPPQWLVTLNLTNVDKTGHFILPLSAKNRCDQIDEDGAEYVCSDTLSGYQSWLKDLQFNVTVGNSAELEFVANDNGFPNAPEPLTSEVSTTFITVEQAIIPPTGSDSTMTIVAGSVGAAAALALGLAVFALRKKLGQPSNDYFDLANQTVDGVPENPLYKAEAQTVENRMYNPNAGV